MQIRLTVLAPHSGASAARACDVLVTAPAGTALAAVASGLATVVSGPDASGAVVLYAGQERLDAQRCALGEPPLVDGAVLSLQVPGGDDAPAADAPARLHVVAGPDAGGVHLLHGGQIRIGRSADADVPLDDPDVSRIHCAITVADDGRVTVADLGSTNGTTVDGADVGTRPVRLAPGALLRVGESALRLAGRGADTETVPTTPDGEGHLRICPAGGGEPSSCGTGPAGDPGGPLGGPAAGGSGLRTAASGAPSGGGPYGSGGLTRAAGPSSDSYLVDGVIEEETADGGHTRAGEFDDADGEREAHSRTRAPRPQTTPARGTRLPEGVARKRGIGAWARRLTGGRGDLATAADAGGGRSTAAASGPDRPPVPETWPDPAAVLLTALGPGPRLWERGPGHPEALVVRLGTADRADLAGVPVTVALREAGSLGLAGPKDRLPGLARSVVAQLAALHSPADLEIVLISADRTRPVEERRRAWGWLGWLPHLRPAHGQDCRLLLAYDRDQAAARTAELTRRLDDSPLGPGWASADRKAVTEAAAGFEGPYTVVVVDGDPGSAALRETTARLAGAGAAAGIHLICLADAPAASPLSPVAATYETACAQSLAFRECGAVGLLSGDVATALRLLRTTGGQAAGHGTLATVDAVSVAWADRFGRALAPLRTEGAAGGGRGAAALALPQSARLLDELGLARATPASLMARWASAPEGTLVLGAGPHGPVAVDLTAEGPHLLIEGPAGSGRTELLRSIAASLAAGGRPDRLALLLVDGAGGERGDGLAPCTDLPHVTEHLVASDPVRMRDFAQALGAELKRRAEILGSEDFAAWHTRQEVAARLVSQRAPSAAERTPRPDARPSVTDGVPSPGAMATRDARAGAGAPEPGRSAGPAGHGAAEHAGADPRGGRIAVRTDAAAPAGTPGRPTPPSPGAGEAALPRLVVLVDDYDALVAPALGSTGRPSAGSVVRALEAVARGGARLGVHLIAASGRPERTADTELAHGARLRVVLDAPGTGGPDEPSPGRGRLGHPDGRVTPFQGGRVTGRIPRTATLRPTVVALEWERMGDPPTRRPVRELGNGPTDLALLASALERAARSVDAAPPVPLSPASRT
ncbi:FHA domain-containing protein [Streptomyces purpureus]|uniref:FHA domain-containing protein n=1 Tax=Streptomyces purpureus TaxID=1951 RepID=UPI000368A673|nr:FHA domain-containing protein [Streptomyces purpureus]